MQAREEGKEEDGDSADDELEKLYGKNNNKAKGPPKEEEEEKKGKNKK
jgi:hypothetical protein